LATVPPGCGPLQKYETCALACFAPANTATGQTARHNLRSTLARFEEDRISPPLPCPLPLMVLSLAALREFPEISPQRDKQTEIFPELSIYNGVGVSPFANKVNKKIS
jgi:hypothetical protein